MRRDSDVDLLLDFPDAPTTQAAQDMAEDACGRLSLACDIAAIAGCTERFLQHVMKHAEPIE